MDFDSVMKAGSRMGTGTMIVLDQTDLPGRRAPQPAAISSPTSPAAGARPAGRACPGPRSMLEAIENGQGEPGDLDILAQLGNSLWLGKTYCALAPGAMEPLRSGLKLFREDFERHIREKKCSYKMILTLKDTDEAYDKSR